MLDSTDFGHSVGEVELNLMLAEDEEGKAHGEIDAFMGPYPWFFDRGERCEGEASCVFEDPGHGECCYWHVENMIEQRQQHENSTGPWAKISKIRASYSWMPWSPLSTKKSGCVCYRLGREILFHVTIKITWRGTSGSHPLLVSALE